MFDLKYAIYCTCYATSRSTLAESSFHLFLLCFPFDYQFLLRCYFHHDLHFFYTILCQTQTQREERTNEEDIFDWPKLDDDAVNLFYVYSPFLLFV